MTDFKEEAQAALDKVRAQMNDAAGVEQSIVNWARPHMVWIALGGGLLLGFIAGHVHL